jgi:hypothetical protein
MGRQTFNRRLLLELPKASVCGHDESERVG